MEWDKKIAGIISVVGAVVVNLLGGWDVLVYGIVAFMIADVVSGLMLSFVQHKASSSIGLQGIMKKVMILLMIAVAVIVDQILGNTGVFRTLVIMFYISMEGLSVLENAVGLGLNVPDEFRERLAQLNEGEKKAVIVQTVNQAMTETVDGITKETNREIITSTSQKEG